VIGFDLSAVAQVAEQSGCDPAAIDLLAASIEPVMVEALTNDKGDDGERDPDREDLIGMSRKSGNPQRLEIGQRGRAAQGR